MEFVRSKLGATLLVTSVLWAGVLFGTSSAIL